MSLAKADPTKLDRWEHDLYDGEKKSMNDEEAYNGRREGTRSYRGHYDGPRSYRPRRFNAHNDKDASGKYVIANLHWKVTEADLKELFGKFGIQQVKLRYDATDRSIGVADLVFESEEQGAAAMEKFNGMLLDEQSMEIRAWDPAIDRYRDTINMPHSEGDMAFLSRTIGNRREGFRTTSSMLPKVGRDSLKPRTNGGRYDDRSQRRDRPDEVSFRRSDHWKPRSENLSFRENRYENKYGRQYDRDLSFQRRKRDFSGDRDRHSFKDSSKLDREMEDYMRSRKERPDDRPEE